MAKQQIICPYCGAEQNVSEVKGFRCSFCGGDLYEEKNHTNNIITDKAQINSIVPFAIDEDKVEGVIAWELANNESVPIDIFDSLIFEVEKAYVPFWEFRGTIQVTWFCQELYRNIHGYIYNKHYREGNPKRDFRVYVSKYESKSLLFKGGGRPLEFDPKLIDEDIVVYKPIDEYSAWKDYKTQESISKEADNLVHKCLPRDYEGLEYRSDWSYTHSSCCLMPLLILRYRYKGREYEFLVNGNDGTIIDSEFPTVKKDTLYNNDDIIHPISLSFFGWMCFILLLIGLLVVFFSFTNFRLDFMGLTTGLLGIALALLSFIFGIWISGNQDEEKESYKELIDCRRRSYSKEIRLQRLIDVPILKRYRHMMNIDQKYSPLVYNKRVKRDRFLMKIQYFILITLFALLSFYIYDSYEKTKHVETELQVKEYQRLEQLQKAQSEIDRVALHLFFYKSKNQIGHLNQNIQKRLREMGFKNEECPRDYGTNCEGYTLYSSDNATLMKIFINVDDKEIYINSLDKVKNVYISVIDDELRGYFEDRIRSQLKDYGFVNTENQSYDFSHPKRPTNSYMRKGKEICKEYNSIIPDHKDCKYYATWDAVVFRSDKMCFYSKDEIKEDIPKYY